MTTDLPLLARSAAVALLTGTAILLAGCAAPTAGAVDGPAATSGPAQPAEDPAGQPAQEPAGEPDVPFGDADSWLYGLQEASSALRATLGEWDDSGCTVAAAIDGEYLCTGALTSSAILAANIDELFASVGDQGFSSADLAGLEPVGVAAAAGAAAHAAWVDAECNWEASPECTPAAEDVLAAVTSLRDALDTWAA
ncbi:MAG TPA: hypothetical protein VIL55_13510 [Naasia sp.]|jgi:hypothetical protein